MSVRASPEQITAQLRSLLVRGIGLGSLLGVPSAIQMLFAEPAVSTIPRPPAAAVSRAADGLFHAQITLKGRNLDCVIDTGATNLIIPARSLRGIDSTGSRSPGHLITAAGVVQATRVRFDDVGFAGRQFADVPAVIADGAAPCLVGQDMLSRLDAVVLRDGRLELR